MTKKTHTNPDFELMDKLQEDYTVAGMVVRHASYWRREGLLEGLDRGHRAGKVDRWGFRFLILVVGIVLGCFGEHYLWG